MTYILTYLYVSICLGTAMSFWTSEHRQGHIAVVILGTLLVAIIVPPFIPAIVIWHLIDRYLVH